MGMQARTELAIIDHNHNTDREQAVKVLLHSVCAEMLVCTTEMHEYSKRTKKWVVEPIAQSTSNMTGCVT